VVDVVELVDVDVVVGPPTVVLVVVTSTDELVVVGTGTVVVVLDAVCNAVRMESTQSSTAASMPA